jgi:membrane-associated phospholipid phosphatase
MGKKIARIISYVFHPLFVPTYAMLILFNISSHYVHVLPFNYKMILLGFVFLFTCLLPSVSLFIMVKLKLVSSLEMHTRKERPAALFLVALFFYATYYIFNELPVNKVFTVFMLGATLLVLMSLLINYFYKISLHMMALGALLATLGGFSFLIHQDIRIYLFLVILIAGITGTARLTLKAHTPSQVYTGFLLGFFTILGLYWFI